MRVGTGCSLVGISLPYCTVQGLVLPKPVEEVIEEELNKLSFLDNHSSEFRYVRQLHAPHVVGSIVPDCVCLCVRACVRVCVRVSKHS